ncbi:3-isopropylmalate dehydratase small subunit [Pseudoroseomonas wenyumeiae]|uniref:3-isopropylmalate dehydratase small subunit n=1 Tax=Teichococcus wenyumeiae TaxID=2478470 RepID=A0A3A9JJV6_9PROT|nr:3-isopropylmalate dehydratase small subunit [Pseudoroseomonas wenyumeiae]RKK05063.1 3-isopropylmalate dehydratase small subunit [Pseudoroseomonas wenyumeiae]RMI25061.1 3-isopropylmalate dehydratase small subunit [Pseudoroseomonas wenyumeiae]
MSLTYQGRVHRFGDEVNTDVILPGRYLALRKPEELGRHCMEGLDPDFIRRVQPGDILAVGRNFGCGSSREHAVIALKAAGVAAIVAQSAARIFFRNAVNLGLPVILCPEAAAALREGEEARIDLGTMAVTQGAASWQAAPLGDEVNAILAAGGLVQRVRAALAA